MILWLVRESCDPRATPAGDARPGEPFTVSVGAPQPLGGSAFPRARLQRFDGVPFYPENIPGKWVAYYFYPGIRKTSPSSESFPAEDDAQHRAFRDSRGALEEHEVRTVGISSQSEGELRETINTNQISHLMLRDPGLVIAESLGLPTFEHANRTWYQRLTLLTREGTIEWACYPVDDPAAVARQILTWLQLSGRA
jgi:peroxiredoxin